MSPTLASLLPPAPLDTMAIWLKEHSLAVLAGLSSSIAVLSHLLYFIHGEHHKKALLFFRLVFIGLPVCCSIMVYLFALTVSRSIQITATVAAAYLGALWTSMIIYRSFFHCLHHFPGPPLAKISKFYHLSRAWRLNSFRLLTSWHLRYGNFIRIGPAELSIVSPNAATAILGPASPCLKSGWYDYGYGQPLSSIHSTRDPAIHESRRRIWDKAFSIKALRGYEPRLFRYTRQLMDQIAARKEQPMNISMWLNYYSFDVMGDLAFGKSFNMLESGSAHWVMELLEAAMLPMGFLMPTTWLIPVLAHAPLLGNEYRRFFAWCAEQIIQRQSMKVSEPDITSHLLTDPKGDRTWLNGDARLIVVAGSDTTAITMTHIFYYLAKFPAMVEKLREELATLIPPDASFSARDIQNANYLNGLINEALRLHPSVPGGVYRQSPPQGITIDNVYVPGNVQLVVPHYTIGRSEECWVRPNECIPERWYSQPELILNKNAYCPFSLGPYGCIGKQLALQNMRIVVAMLVTRFDMRFADGEDGSSLIDGSLDTFTLRMKSLMLVFADRKPRREKPEMKTETETETVTETETETETEREMTVVDAQG